MPSPVTPKRPNQEGNADKLLDKLFSRRLKKKSFVMENLHFRAIFFSAS